MLKTLLIALVCLLTGYVLGGMFSAARVLPSDNEITVNANTPQPGLAAANSNLPAKVVTPPQVQDETGADSIEALEARILQLEQQLAQQSEVFEQALAQPADTASAFTPAEAKPRMNTATIEEVEAVLPQPFAGLVAGFKGTLVERFHQLENEAVNYDWAPLMEQRIADFISMHQLSGGVQLQAVRCKNSLCEVRGFELEDNSWNQILSNMQAQPWWQFNNSHSSGKTSAEFGHFFYMLAARELQAEE
ncbi:hypothetical protein [Rheinheimera sp.]|uniref:hypothetical protein n=1 Tax=Rheinheimera sp. TaxID=1869214 RepID=UPI002734348A|nr:hypothetical protein [Rheinheimera sp.]MDP2716194.1 hypothetical protein [Rheinheimera sp.]